MMGYHLVKKHKLDTDFLFGSLLAIIQSDKNS